MTRSLVGSLSRLGKEVEVWSEANTGGEDAFGQDQKGWSQVGTTLTARSYQNRNTTLNNSSGELNRDRPVFFFPADNYPNSGERIKYDGNWYEMDSPTPHRTHAVAVGSKVLEENFPP